MGCNAEVALKVIFNLLLGDANNDNQVTATVPSRMPSGESKPTMLASGGK